MLLTMMVCGSCMGAPSSLPPPAIPEGLGVNIHFAGSDMAQVNKIADAGFRFVRMDFGWGGVETKKGEYSFKIFDELVDSMAARNIRVILILDYSNPIYENSAPPLTDEARAAFAAYAKAGAAHFKGRGVVWEIYNEPNGDWFWKQPKAEDYVKLAKVTYKAIKEADQDSVVIGPASCGSWARKYLEEAFKSGLLEYVDAVSVHPYGCKKPEDANVFYSWLRRKISQYGPKGASRPIISGEWGYPSLPSSTFGDGVTLEGQADYLARMLLVNTMNGCPISIWYDWRNDGTGTNPGDREHNFGTLFFDFKEKPSYVAMKTLYKELDGYSFVRRISMGTINDYVILLRKGGDYRIAAWTVGDAHTVSIPVDTPVVNVVSLMGDRKSMAVENETINVDLAGSVQYIEPAAPCRRWALDTSWRK